MTRAEFAGAIFTLVVVGLAVWHAMKPRGAKLKGPEAATRYIEEMRSHTRQRAAHEAASKTLNQLWTVRR